MDKIQVDSLIIGSGIAGLNLARKLAQGGQKVFIASKEAVTEGSSKYAQGGVAVYTPLNTEDKLESHIQDTMRSGKGLCDEVAVSKILAEGWSKVEELIKLGVKFDEGFSIEGSHSYSRVMHVADATGRAIMKPLLDNVSRNHNVHISQGTECLSLIKQNERVVGARFKTVSGEEFDIFAAAVVLATGGLASLYRESTNPGILIGDGLALAYDAGAELENLEFIQFHPTVFKAKSGKNFLISEAVRGAGALLRNITGELFAEKYHPDAELATRDIVSRAIVQEMRETKSDFVYLDFTRISKETLEKEFPNIYHKCQQEGFDLTKDLLPVCPAAHYSIGGVKTDIKGSTNIPGLYALGECASTGLHGANRLASNSLLECITMPDFIAQDILENICNVQEELASTDRVYTSSATMQASNESADLDAIRLLVSMQLGIEREAAGLQQAIGELENMDAASKAKTVALLIARSALAREESRGAHFRSDFPAANPIWQQSTVVSNSSLDRVIKL